MLKRKIYNFKISGYLFEESRVSAFVVILLLGYKVVMYIFCDFFKRMSIFVIYILL